MSRNLSSISARSGVRQGVYERMTATDAADTPETLRQLGELSGFGDAMTAGAVSCYDRLRKEDARTKVWVCNGTACLCAGTQDGLRRELGEYFAADEIGDICCLGRCHEARAFQYGGRNYSGIAPDRLGQVFEGDGPADGGGAHAVLRATDPPWLTAPFPGIAEFYAPLEMMLGRSRERFAQELRESGLRGRGGAGFPVHLKWQACRMADDGGKYIVCNADEGDPGSYIDRYLLEQRPHAVLAGMLAAAWFAKAATGVIYIRGEYPEALRRMQEAIGELHAAGWLGSDIRGRGFSFDLTVLKGCGAYICGEETALLAGIEGRRPEPCARPPYPAEHGLFGKPTIVNNVETFANIPVILAHGAARFAATGTPCCTGTKLLSLDGHFARPGICEVAMGTPLDEVVALAGGFRTAVKALQIGGPLGCVVPVGKTAGLRVDIDAFRAAGFELGHGGVIAIPEGFPMIRMMEHLFRFAEQESCGKCFPCRLGSIRGRELISRAAAGDGFRIDRQLLDDLLETLAETSLCGLGGGLPGPLRNILEHFADELRPYFSATGTPAS